MIGLSMTGILPPVAVPCVARTHAARQAGTLRGAIRSDQFHDGRDVVRQNPHTSARESVEDSVCKRIFAERLDHGRVGQHIDRACKTQGRKAGCAKTKRLALVD